MSSETPSSPSGNEATNTTGGNVGGGSSSGGLGHSQPLRSVQSPSIHGTGVVSAVPTYHHKTLIIDNNKPTTINTSNEVPTTASGGVSDVVKTTTASTTVSASASVPRKQQQTTGQQHTMTRQQVHNNTAILGKQEISLDKESDIFLSRYSNVLRPAPLLDDERGIIRVRSLMSRRAYLDVIRITSELLQTATSPYASFHSDLLHMDLNSQKHKQSNLTIARLEQETAEIISLRFIAMLKLKRYSDLGREVDRLNLLDEYTLPWVPFGLQILAAHTLQYTEQNNNKQDKCIDKLHRMKYRLSRENQHWLSTIITTLSNIFTRQKEYRLALSSLNDLLNSIPNTVQFLLEDYMHNYFRLQETNEQSLSNDQLQYLASCIIHSCRIEILSRQGRILLQVGAVPEAEYIFTTIENDELVKLNSSLEHASRTLMGDDLQTLFKVFKSCDVIQQAPMQTLLNNGLLLFAKEEYKIAMDAFKLAIDKERTINKNKENNNALNTPNSIFQENFLSPGLGFTIENTIITSCLNNISLCALYTCQMNKAVNYMEQLICENPAVYLTEGLAFNICTLYELGSENSISNRKKILLQHIAKRFFLHDITPEYFRIV